MAHYTNITAPEMAAFLEPQGFKRISVPGTVELVWAKRVDKPLKNGGKVQLSLRVNSGINPSGESRDVGADAIRVVLFIRKDDGQVFKLAGDKRVHRVEGWRNNLQNRLNKWDENMKLCPACGNPMAERKGKNGKFLGCVGYPICRHTENIASPAVQPHAQYRPTASEVAAEQEIMDIEGGQM